MWLFLAWVGVLLSGLALLLVADSLARPLPKALWAVSGSFLIVGGTLWLASLLR